MGTKKPSTHIHRPLAKAVTAKATTKMLKIDETKTTKDSAATRSKNNHSTHLKNADASAQEHEKECHDIIDTSECGHDASARRTFASETVYFRQVSRRAQEARSGGAQCT